MLGHVGHVVEVEQIVRHVVPEGAVPVGHGGIPDAAQHCGGVVHHAVLNEVVVQLYVGAGGGSEGHIVGAFLADGEAILAEKGHGAVQIGGVYQHVDVAAGTHPRLGVVLPQHRALQGQERYLPVGEQGIQLGQVAALRLAAIDGQQHLLFKSGPQGTVRQQAAVQQGAAGEVGQIVGFRQGVQVCRLIRRQGGEGRLSAADLTGQQGHHHAGDPVHRGTSFGVSHGNTDRGCRPCPARRGYRRCTGWPRSRR